MDIEEIRRKKIKELENRLVRNQPSISNLGEEELVSKLKELERVASIVLDDKAYDRLNNIKLVNEDLALNVMTLLYQLYASGRIKNKIEDNAFKELLLQVTPKERKTKIIRK